MTCLFLHGHRVLIFKAYLNNSTDNLVADLRHQVIWIDEGIASYQEKVLQHLLRLQDIWSRQQPAKNYFCHSPTTTTTPTTKQP